MSQSARAEADDAHGKDVDCTHRSCYLLAISRGASRDSTTFRSGGSKNQKHLPWNAVVDRMEPEEEAIGFIHVLPRGKMAGPPSQNAGYEPISGIGEEAYFRNNRNRYAELYVRVGNHTLTLQASADGNIEAAKPRVVSLAQTLIAKLR